MANFKTRHLELNKAYHIRYKYGNTSAKFTKKEQIKFANDIVKFILELAEEREDKNKIISSSYFGKYINQIKTVNRNILTSYFGHISEYNYKETLQSIADRIKKTRKEEKTND